MLMIQAILIITGLVLFIENLFDKWHVWHSIEKASENAPVKLLYMLMQCKWCMLFWLGVLICLFYNLADGFCLADLLTPFVVSGLITLKFKK